MLQVMNAINRLATGMVHPGVDNSSTTFPFPMFNQSTDVTVWPDRFGLGYLIGYLNGFEGVGLQIIKKSNNWNTLLSV